MPENMEQMLWSEYGIQALSLQAVPSGWSASAWKVRSGRGDFFLKVYDKYKPSTRSWIARIGSYMPVVLWLHENTELRGKMTAPLLTKDGAYKWEDEASLCMVFPFIAGQPIGGGKLNPVQIRELAQIAAQLHAYGAGIPVPTESLQETFGVSFCAELEHMRPSGKLKAALAPYQDTILQKAESLEEMAAALRGSQMRYALCHTDIHGWNLMQADRLVLIDWEGLKLAPVEADLFSLTETFFFADAWEVFLPVYRAAHKDYQVNPLAMRFYRLRRRMEDIQAFAQSILMDHLSQDDMDRPLRCLRRECELLGVMR